MMIKNSTTAKRAPFKKKEGPTDVDAHVGQQIRLRRTLLGLTQEAVATATGLTFQQIQKYEQGKNRVSASRLLQLCELLNVEPNFFFEPLLHSKRGFGLAEEQEAYQPYPVTHTKETIELLRAYYSIQDSKMRKNILKIIKQMASGPSGDQ
jgi:transcriptional regulator with XRE-family HTH domain